ncbi:MAG: AraC family transcriptional regulator [Micrococcales bacterium]|nr:MAG: AraC family transcriptional regulator [Micrococcales bacterium]PIE27168.1 MAG: AraC family transcriptional regulator [Micrococcales bacterium]
MAERQPRKDSHVRPPLPAPAPAVPGGLVDNHTHLDHESDDTVVRGLLAAGAHVGVPRAVTIGCNLPAAEWTAGAVTRFDQLLGGVAIHPNTAPRHAADGNLDDALARIEELARGPRIAAISETGLDWFRTDRDDAPARSAQEYSFRAHIEMAKRLGLPMQIHDRDAHEDVLRILADEGAPDITVFHCFSGDEQMARFCAGQGWYLSFAGTLTFKNAHQLRAAAAAVPPGQLLVETDAPYLTPMPYRGKPNASYLIPLTLRALAQTRSEPEQALAEQITKTSERLYGPW